MNMTLDGLESRLKSEFGQKGSNDAHANQINLVRYADDFIITGRSKERLEHEVKPLVESFLKERGLALSGEKTRITHVDEGFDFLGWNIRKYDGKLLSKPSRKNVKAFLEDLRETIKTHRQAKQENLIGVLNPKIQGWVNYHKGSVATVTFARVSAITGIEGLFFSLLDGRGCSTGSGRRYGRGSATREWWWRSERWVGVWEEVELVCWSWVLVVAAQLSVVAGFEERSPVVEELQDLGSGFIGQRRRWIEVGERFVGVHGVICGVWGYLAV
jgi:hypothetical protein